MSITTGLPVDNQQRIMALDPECSFICEAPAGSGKTELLAQRVLTLLARVQKPESILAITFTRKAAAEMRDRILGALISGVGPEPVDDHAKKTWLLAKKVLSVDSALGWNLLLNPNRLQVRTFDSLCAMLTRALPIHSALGASVGISGDTEPLYRKAVLELIGTLEQDVPWAEDLSDLLLHLDNKYARVEELLMKMLHSRDSWMPILNIADDEEAIKHVLESHLQSAIGDKQAQIEQLISPDLKSRILELGCFAAANLTTLGLSSSIVYLHNVNLTSAQDLQLDSAHWAAISDLLLTKTGAWRKRFDKNCGFPIGADKTEKAAFKQQKAAMLQLVGELSALSNLHDALQGVSFWPTSNYDVDQWSLLRSLTRVLPILVAQLQLVFRSQGEVDFLEMSARAHQALGSEEEPTDLLLRLDHSIQHILTDEFQDTSFGQIGLLQKLTMGWQEGDGRTLFCVGDAMQSIYGFRGANVGLFLNCKTEGLGDVYLQPLQLTTNFRSQEGVVEWINQTFETAFPSSNDISTGAVVYAHSDHFRPRLEDPAVVTHLYSKDAPPAFEGSQIVDLIQGVRKDTPDASVAILVRTKNHAKSAVRALKSAGIKFRAVDLESLGERAVIQDLMSLTRALLYPEDRVAWFSVLRAPWCGLTLTDMELVSQQICHSSQELVLAQLQKSLSASCSAEQLQLTDDGRSRLLRVVPTLVQAMAERSRKPLRQWVEGVWVQLGGPACLQALDDCDNAERFFECLEGLNDTGELPTIDTLSNSIAALFAAPDPSSDDRLQIMTIHKSKGLEFDVVVLPGLHRRPRAQDSELLLWQKRLSLSGEEQWLLAPIGAVGDNKDPVYKYLEHEKNIREGFESCRLLYVACTRAKKALHLFAETQKVEGEINCFRAPSSSSLLARIWPSIEGSANTVYSEAPEPSDEIEGDVENASPLVRLPIKWQLPRLPEGRLLERFVAHSNFDNSKLSTGPASVISKLPSYVGTLIHQIIQLIGEQGIELWRDTDLSSKAPFWRSRLIGLGATEFEADGALPEVLLCIERVLTSERFHWLMSGECQFELPLTGCSKGVYKDSVLDLLMIEETGQAWVVDYKTSTPRAGETLSIFITQKRAQYSVQLAHYRDLVRQLGYSDVRSAIFFVALDHWIEC